MPPLKSRKEASQENVVKKHLPLLNTFPLISDFPSKVETCI